MRKFQRILLLLLGRKDPRMSCCPLLLFLSSLRFLLHHPFPLPGQKRIWGTIYLQMTIGTTILATHTTSLTTGIIKSTTGWRLRNPGCHPPGAEPTSSWSSYCSVRYRVSVAILSPPSTRLRPLEEARVTPFISRPPMSCTSPIRSPSV
jgi:hypothetical protein